MAVPMALTAALLLAAPALGQTRSGTVVPAATAGLVPVLPGFSSLAPLSAPLLSGGGLPALSPALAPTLSPALPALAAVQTANLLAHAPAAPAAFFPHVPLSTALGLPAPGPAQARAGRAVTAARVIHNHYASIVTVDKSARPTLSLAAERLGSARSLGNWSAELAAWFDGSKPGAGAATPAPSGPPASSAPGRFTRLRRELKALSAPWRTQRNLARLEESPRGPSESFEFALVGDAEPGRFWWTRLLFNRSGVFLEFLRRIAGQPVDFVLQLGDMVSRGKARNFLAFFRELASVALPHPFLTVIGNHDRRRPHGVSDSMLYRALFGPTDYYFDRGGVRFVVLDTSAKRLLPRQLEWLDRALDTDKLKIVFTHMPPDPLRSWVDYGAFKGAGGFQLGAEEFTRLVARRGVARVYMGHVHGFGVRDYLGVRYVLSGGGGSALFPSGIPRGDRFHHYITVRVGPDGVRETVHKADGTSFELR